MIYGSFLKILNKSKDNDEVFSFVKDNFKKFENFNKGYLYNNDWYDGPLSGMVLLKNKHYYFNMVSEVKEENSYKRVFLLLTPTKKFILNRNALNLFEKNFIPTEKIKYAWDNGIVMQVSNEFDNQMLFFKIAGWCME